MDTASCPPDLQAGNSEFFREGAPPTLSVLGKECETKEMSRQCTSLEI
jgi:hypothetical protein